MKSKGALDMTGCNTFRHCINVYENVQFHKIVMTVLKFFADLQNKSLPILGLVLRVILTYCYVLWKNNLDFEFFASFTETEYYCFNFQKKLSRK